MNKYEEALKTICEYTEYLYISRGVGRKHLLEQIKVMRDLVKKTTPMKPKNQRYDNANDVGGGVCDCESLVYEYHTFCPKCGQSLDWSEDE